MLKRIPHAMTGLQQATIVSTCLDGQLVSTTHRMHQDRRRVCLELLHYICCMLCKHDVYISTNPERPQTIKVAINKDCT